MKLGLFHQFIFMGVVLVFPLSLQAAIFTPNVLNDPTPNPAPNGCVNAGPNPQRCSLREASISANANDEADTIVLSAGTYLLSRPETGGETGDLYFVEIDGSNDITLQGAGSDQTIVEADVGLNSRLMFFSGGTATINLSGFTVKGGSIADSGGGILISNGMPIVTIQDCSFEDNHSSGGLGGGGLFIGGGSGSLTMENVDFLGNSALSGGGLYTGIGSSSINIDGGLYQNNQANESGGGIRFGGSTPAASNLFEVQNIIVSNNKALNGNGGGIFHSTGGGLRLRGVQVTENSAQNPGDNSGNGNGGGVYASNGGSPLVAEVINSVISENTATGNTIDPNKGGGGIYTGGSGGTRILNSTIADNRATGSGLGGGGIFLSGGPSSGLQILGSTFSGNEARNGGGLYHENSDGNLREITNSTFSGNTSVRAGGAIYIDRNGTGFSLNSVTLVQNSAGTSGGGLNNIVDPLILRNSIFGGNSAADGTSGDCVGTSYESDGYNIFSPSGNSDCEPNGLPVGNHPNDIVGDPMVAALADNGGLTFTHALFEGSPAIDGGNPGGCENGNGADLTTDQRGFERPTGSACDIGAFEAAVADLEIVKTADESVYVVGEDIAYTLTVTNNGPDAAFAFTSDELPAEVSLVSMDAACIDNAGIIACDLGSLDPGESASVQIVVEAINDGTTANTATVSGADIDPNPDNNSSTVSVDVLSNGSGGGGCRISATETFSSPLTWGLFMLGLLGAIGLRSKVLHERDNREGFILSNE